MKNYAIFGSGGFGREVAPIASQMLNAISNDRVEVFFVDDDPKAESVNGYRQLSYDDFFSLDGDKYFNIAIASGEIRKEVASRLIADGAHPFSVSCINSSMNLSSNVIGEGAIICPHSTITANSKIGRFFHSNIYSYVAHDCFIGDFVTFAPRVSCNGGVVIEDYAYIGTGAVIRQGTKENPIVIGEGAVVGMGAIVTKSVEPFSTVVGNPAKPLKKS